MSFLSMLEDSDDEALINFVLNCDKENRPAPKTTTSKRKRRNETATDDDDDMPLSNVARTEKQRKKAGRILDISPGSSTASQECQVSESPEENVVTVTDVSVQPACSDTPSEKYCLDVPSLRECSCTENKLAFERMQQEFLKMTAAFNTMTELLRERGVSSPPHLTSTPSIPSVSSIPSTPSTPSSPSPSPSFCTPSNDALSPSNSDPPPESSRMAAILRDPKWETMTRETGGPRLTLKLTALLFEEDELASSTPTGYRGGHALDAQRLAMIKNAVVDKFGSADSIWKKCVMAISNKCKLMRYRKKNKSFE